MARLEQRSRTAEIPVALPDRRRPAQRFAWRMRWLFVRGLAAVVAGVVVLGIGGRIVMLASRLLHPDAVGRLTENGNRIGEFTVEGTIGLVLFGGLLGGLFGAVVWVFVRDWIGPRPWLVGLASAAIGGSSLIVADNRDFVILGDVRLDLVLLVGLVVVFGATVASFDGWFERLLPPAPSKRATAAYTLLVLVASQMAVPAFGSFFSEAFCFCSRPPVWTGVFLTGAAMASVWWWILHLTGADQPPTAVRYAGAGFVGLAVVAGAIHLTLEILQIL